MKAASSRRAPVAVLIVLCGMALFAPGQTYAQVDPGAADSAVADASGPAELRQLLPQARLVGKTRLTVWGFQVYDARLLALPGFKAETFASQPFALELTYLRDFSNAEIAERSLTEMRRSATISPEDARAWTAELMRVLPNVKKGDRIMGLYKPGVGAQFLVKGKRGGEIADAEFARLFFGIWLSPKTSEPQMRSALIGSAP